MHENQPIYLVYGTSGVGKTTIGKRLAQRLDLPFYDADDFHPPHNVEKMAAGEALDDADRWPWLNTLAAEMVGWHAQGGAVLACSALKEVYRRKLAGGVGESRVRWILLWGDFELIAERLKQREDHFFDPSLLRDQFETLEKPDYGCRVSVDRSIETVVEEALMCLEDYGGQTKNG